MHRPSPLAIALGLSLSLAACFEEAAGPDASSTDPTVDRDGTDPFVAEDDIDITVVWDFALRPVGVSPWTTEAGADAVVRIELDGDVVDGDGAEGDLEQAVAETAWMVVLPDGSEVEATATAEGRRIVVEVTVPHGETTSKRQALAVYAGDDFVAEAAVGRWAAPEAVLGDKLGDPTGFLGEDEVGGLELCWAGVDDADADGVLEVLMVGIDDDERAVFRACRGFLDERSGEWVCEEETLEADLEDGVGLFCGSTDHFLPAGGGGSQVSAVFHTSRGGIKATSGPLWSGDAWTTPPPLTDQTSVGLSGRVLGFNSTKEEAEVPLDALLLLRGDGSRWTGIYQDGREPGEWTDMMGVSATDVGAGAAWAGLFAAHDLRPLRDGDLTTEDPLVWAVSPEAGARSATLVLHTGSWNAGLSAFVRSRQVALGDPGFAAEHVTAAGEDLDRDGVPELVVEAWGEGRYAAWVVRSATDKADTRPVLQLETPYLDGVTVSAPVQLGAEGQVNAVPSTFSAASTGGELRHWLPTLPSPRATEGDLVWGTWTIDSASEDPSVSPDGASLMGGSSATECAEGVPSRGFCQHGRCFCVPGWQGAAALGQGGGDGALVSSIAADSPVFVSAGGSQTNVLARIPPTGTTRPRLHIRSGTLGSWRIGLAAGASGAWVTVDDEPVVQTTVHARVAAAPDSGGELAVFVFEPSPIEAASRSADEEAATALVPITVRVHYHGVESLGAALPPETATGGTTIPTLLDDAVSEEGGVLLGWRDGLGQAWVGVVDLNTGVTDDGVLAFLGDPVALGGPVRDPDADGVFGWTTHSRIVGQSTGVIADTPFLSMEDLEERVSDWDRPAEGGFDAGEAPYGPALALVGTDDGFVEEAYIAAFADIASMEVATGGQAWSLDEARVPRVAFSPVADGPQVVASTSADGAVTLTALDASGLWAQTTLTTGVSVDGPVSAGDINGDGLADLVLGSGASAAPLLSDGAGGVLDAPVEAQAYTNFAVLLGGAGGDRECAVDPDGGGEWTDVALRLGVRSTAR